MQNERFRIPQSAFRHPQWKRLVAALCIVALTLFIPLSGLAWGAGETVVSGPRLWPAMALPSRAYMPGRILVKFWPKAQLSVQAVMDDMGLRPLGHLRALDVYIVEVTPGSELETAARLAAHPAVAYAEPDVLVQALATPNDPYYVNGYQWNLTRIKAEQAWDTTTGSSDIVIAIVDTGVDLSHPDLAAKIVAGYDFVNGDSDASDDHGHGTHVASIAAALSNNGRGLAGVSWGARIMPVKVLSADGSGLVSNVANGICWAADHGADVINLSLGGPAAATLQSAVDYAYNAGALVVAAAGNSYKEGNPPIYPAACNHVLAVAATNDLDGHASYSSSGSYVDVAAPGGDPTSSSDSNPNHWIVGAYWRGKGCDYAWGAGTSQAAPHVAGLAALLLSVNSSLTNNDLEVLIRNTAVDVSTPGWDEFTGYGRIDAQAAVAAASAQPSSSYVLTKQLLTAEPVRVNDPLSFVIRITNTGDSWISVLPLQDVYDTAYLSYAGANPPSDDQVNDGVVDWSDLTASLGQDLAPGASFTVTVTFWAGADTTGLPDNRTVNTAIVHDALADPDGPGPLGAGQALPTQQDSASVRITNPTGLTLASFAGAAQPDGVLLTWETASELELVGFRLLRREAGQSFAALNEALIFARYAGANQGATYTYRDREVLPGTTYDYALEMVTSDGSVERQGPVSLTVSWWLRLPLVMNVRGQ
ncbi:MAG: S8 family peptidase [Anaerolineae bacterium]|nr:S8 family peptidase [Anaerolineae bacterium]